MYWHVSNVSTWSYDDSPRAGPFPGWLIAYTTFRHAQITDVVGQQYIPIIPTFYAIYIYISCLVVYLPLWNIWIRQLGVWNSQYKESDKIPWFQTTNQYIPFIDSWSMSCLWSFLWRWWIYHPFFAAWPSLIRKMMDHQGSDFDIKNHDMENPLWMEVSSWENHL